MIKDNVVHNGDAKKGYNWNGPTYSSQRIHFLNRHAHQGVRAQDVPEEFDKDLRATYRVLRIVHHFSIQDALKEIAGLNADQAHMLRKYYKTGVRRSHLLSYPHSATQTELLVQYFQWSPREGLVNLATMNPSQFACLHTFADHGLTPREAKQLQFEGELSKLKIDIVMELVKNGVKTYEALQDVLPKSDEQAIKLLQEPFRDFDRAVVMKR